MGDPCDVFVTCRGDYAADLIQIIGFKPYDQFDVGKESGPRIVELAWMQANWGLDSQLRKAANKGGIFYGHASSGGSYGPTVFASDGKKLIDVGAIDNDPVIPVYWDSKTKRAKADSGALKKACEYFKIYERARALMDKER